MEIHKETVGRKNNTVIRRSAIFFGILIAGSMIYFFACGAGRGFFENKSAIAVKSFREAFDLSPGTASEEIAMRDIPKQASSSNDFLDAEVHEKIASGTEDPNDGNVGNKNSTSDMILGNKEGKENIISATSETAGNVFLNEAGLILESAPSSTEVASSSLTGLPSSTTQVNASKKAAVTRCSFPVVDLASTSRRVILNEIAWMGSSAQSGVSAAGASNNEWMEIKNETSSTVSLAGWELLDSVKNITIVFGDADAIGPSVLYLLERTDDSSVPGVTADKIYSGSLPNTGDTIGLFDPSCNAVDILDASDGWPGGDNSTKQTLERDTTGFGWHTSTNPGGTPKIENSVGVAASSPSSAIRTIPSSTESAQNYMVAVTISGDGGGKVVSDPVGISCGSYCVTSYVSGKTVKLYETPGAGDTFSGWMGPCSGTSPDCVFTVTGYVSATAIFHRVISATMTTSISDSIDNESFDSMAPASSSDSEDLVQGSDDGAVQSSSTPSEPSVASDTTSPLGHLVIAAVQIAGASSSNDFVKIYNPEGVSVDISGWKLRKKSSTGTDYSLKEMPTGSLAPAGGYFTWANAANGFSESISADVSSTETLSADNSVALIDASGTVVDAVAWGNGTNQYAEGSVYPTNPAAGQTLMRAFQNGVIVDTDNNGVDFAIQ